MTTTYHTAIAAGAAANASVFNAPLGQLDAHLDDAMTFAVNNNAELVAARSPYTSLDARLDALVLAGGNVATKANGVSAAGQKVLTVDATTGFIVGAYVVYPLNGSATLQGNIIASINAGVSLVLTDDIGATPAGGVLDDSYISMISTSEYLAAQAIPHAGTLLLPQTMEYANGGVFHVDAYGASPNASAAINAAALQAAIDAAEAISTGAIVALGAGSFSYNTGLTLTADNVKITGEAGGLTQLAFTGTGHCIEITGDNCTLENLYITTDANANAGYGVYINGAPGTKLINVTVYNIQYHAVYAVNSWSLYTENCLFTTDGCDAGYSGFYHGSDSNNVLHVRSRFVGMASNIGAYVYSGAQISFVACDFSGSTPGTSTGLSIRTGWSISVRDCYFEWNGGYGIHVGSVAGQQPVGVSITGSYINLNDNENNVGIYVQAAIDCLISGNTFQGNATTGSTGIKAASTGQTITNMVISPDNFFNGCAANITDATGLAAQAMTTAGLNLPWQYAAAAPTNNGRYYSKGEIVWSTDAKDGGPMGWVNLADGPAVKGNWTTTTYVANDYVIASSTKLYRLDTAGGGAAANEPSHTNAAGVTEADGYKWLWILTGQTACAFRPFGQANYRTGAATPIGSVTPFFVGEEYLDYTAEIWYKATYIGDNTHWKALNS